MDFSDAAQDKKQPNKMKGLGEKLKLIESKWIENNFQISEQQIENIINN